MKRLAAAAGWVLLLLAALGAPCTQAGLLHDNGPPDQRNGSEMTHWLEADDFVLAEPARLESIKFWTFEKDGFFAGSIVWQIYSDNGAGEPGNLILSGTSRNLSHVATGFAAFGGFKEFISTFELGPLSLPRGTHWLALHNGPLSNHNTQNFFWEATGRATGAASHANVAPFNGPWNSNAFPGLPSDFAFQLHGVVAPKLTNVSRQGSACQITFTTTAGYNYRVEYKNNLAAGSWTPLPGATRVAGTGSLIQVADAAIGNRASRFYRVALLYDGIGAPVITALARIGGKPRLSFTTAAGYYYRVEYKNDSADLSWSALPGAETIVGTGGVMQFTDSESIGTRPRRIYRIALF